jgi:hypothetical protein
VGAVDILKILSMPFQAGSLLFVAGSSLLLGLVLGSGNLIVILIALAGLWVTLVWLTRYAFRMIDDIANGVREAAAADVEMANPFGDPRCWVHPVLALVLLVMHVRWPQLPVAATLIAVALLFPPSIAASAMSGEARDALNPVAVSQVIRGLGPWFLVTTLSTAACMALAVLTTRLLDAGWLYFAIIELLLLLAYACIGGAVYQRRIELGFAARISPERREEKADRERGMRRQQMLDHLYESLRARDPSRAVDAASMWLREADAHQFATDTQAILSAGPRWNEPRQFAKLLEGLVPMLLARHQHALAFAAADAARTAAGQFVPADEAAAVTLIDYALKTGRRRTAAGLLEDFLKSPRGAATPGPRLAALRDSLRSTPEPAA